MSCDRGTIGFGKVAHIYQIYQSERIEENLREVVTHQFIERVGDLTLGRTQDDALAPGVVFNAVDGRVVESLAGGSGDITKGQPGQQA